MFAVGNNIKTISNINFLDRQAFVSWPLQRTLKTLANNDSRLCRSANELLVFVLSFCSKNKEEKKKKRNKARPREWVQRQC